MAARVVLRSPTAEDVNTLVTNMRPDDFAEVEAIYGAGRVPWAVRGSLAVSTHALACDEDGELRALFGVAPESLLSGAGCPWLLGTERRSGNCSLGRIARRYLAEVRHVYPVLVNHVDVRNEVGVRLLRWLGFHLSEPEPFGVAGLPFMRAELRS